MLPPKRKDNYEKVAIGKMIEGVILPIKYDEKHVFKWQGKETTCPAVRLEFKLNGYEYAHGTPWMRFNYMEKANLYKKYLVELVEGAKPEMEFDLDLIVGIKVNTVWSENNDFQEIKAIFPIDGKLTGWEKAKPAETSVVEDEHEEHSGEEIPF